jgi:hypothetical protein
MKCLVCSNIAVEQHGGCCSRGCLRFWNRRRKTYRNPKIKPRPAIPKAIPIKPGPIKIIEPKFKKVNVPCVPFVFPKPLILKLEPITLNCCRCGCLLTDDIAYEHNYKYYCKPCLQKLSDEATPPAPFIGGGERVIRGAKSLA